MMEGWGCGLSRAPRRCTSAPTGSPAVRVLKRGWVSGRADHDIGYQPLFLLANVLRRVGREPVASSGKLLQGFAWASATRRSRPVSQDFVRFQRKLQTARMLTVLRHPIRILQARTPAYRDSEPMVNTHDSYFSPAHGGRPSKRPEPRLSAIVVCWNARDFVRKCLSSLLQHTTHSLEVIVVDNGSADGTPEAVAAQFPSAVLIRSATNRGFAAANNVGIAAARGQICRELRCGGARGMP